MFIKIVSVILLSITLISNTTKATAYQESVSVNISLYIREVIETLEHYEQIAGHKGVEMGKAITWLTNAKIASGFRGHSPESIRNENQANDRFLQANEEFIQVHREARNYLQNIACNRTESNSENFNLDINVIIETLKQYEQIAIKKEEEFNEANKRLRDAHEHEAIEEISKIIQECYQILTNVENYLIEAVCNQRVY